MRILVTGGAGYIGGVLVRQLLDQGHEVRIVDTFQYSEASLIGGNSVAVSASPENGSRLDLVCGDVRYPKPEWFEGVNAVAHLAGFSNDPTADAAPELNHQVNVLGTLAIAEASIAAGIDRFTFASSASIYDDGNPLNPETKYEKNAVSPIGAYSQSKREAELVLTHPRIANALRPIVLRQGTVYGLAPRMRFDLVVNQMTRDAVCKGTIMVHGGSLLWRPMLSVEACAAVHVAALTSDWNVGPRIVNVVDQNVHVREIATRVASTVSRKVGSHVDVEVIPMPADRRVRNYKVEALEWRDALGPQPMDEMQEQIGMIADWLESESTRDPEFDAYAAKYENLRAMQAAG